MYIKDNFSDIIRLLREGGTLVYPTETTWGIGCSVENEKAIENIYVLKQRSKEKPFVIMVSDIKMLKNYVKEIHPRIETLLEYYERPLTVVYDSPINLPKQIISKQNTVAIRVTRDPFCQQIIHDLGHPIIITSAKKSGHANPNSFEEISDEIKNGVDYVVQYRQNIKKLNKEAVIISYDAEGEIEFLRN